MLKVYLIIEKTMINFILIYIKVGVFMEGILLINKPSGVTSRDVVNEVGKILGTKKIGHTGTLDPIATGVLALCVGKYTKLADILTCDIKEYIVEAVFGVKTDTLDITGSILDTKKTILTKLEIEEAFNRYIGEYNQEVPIYSAVKVNGKKLYDYARQNIDIDLPSRRVHIFEIELVDDIKYDNDYYTIVKFRCLVSKGTYIRSLIRDIANSLDTYGVMKNLTRTIQGNFKLEDCYSIEDIRKNNYKFFDINNCFNDYFKVIVDNFLLNKIKNGQILDNRYNRDKILFFDQNNNLIAIYIKYDKNINKIKPWKVFL